MRGKALNRCLGIVLVRYFIPAPVLVRGSKCWPTRTAGRRTRSVNPEFTAIFSI